MKNRFLTLIVVSFLLLASACQASTPTPTAVAPAPATTEPTALPTEAATPILEFLSSDGNSASMTLQQIEALPVSQGKAGIKSSTGKITLPTDFKGVSLKDLVAADPKFDSSMGLTLYASDGYSITFSYDQVMNGSFVQYDPGTGDELKSPVSTTPILAYEMDGKPLDPTLDGNLRLVVISDEAKQVVDGHWSVKFVNKVEVKSLSKDWTLHLEGAISEDMDRATFESGSSPTCHGVTWTDDKAQVWSGIPLWLLVGRVDDATKHEGNAYNDALADQGYKVDLVASDGYTVTLDSAKIKRSDTILVAYLVDGNPLTDKYFPLRLVGEGLAKNEMIGGIEKIVVHVPAAAETAAPTAEATQPGAANSTAAFSLTGLVAKPLALSDADLHAMDVAKITATNSKGVTADYQGVRLSTLLTAAGVKPDAKKLILTANDGYTSELFLTEAQACKDCLLAFTETAGSYKMVMPNLPSSLWIKGIVSIDIQ